MRPPKIFCFDTLTKATSSWSLRFGRFIETTVKLFLPEWVVPIQEHYSFLDAYLWCDGVHCPLVCRCKLSPQNNDKSHPVLRRGSGSYFRRQPRFLSVFLIGPFHRWKYSTLYSKTVRQIWWILWSKITIRSQNNQNKRTRTSQAKATTNVFFAVSSYSYILRSCSSSYVSWFSQFSPINVCIGTRRGEI